MRDAPPIFFLRHQKENAPRPVEKKKCLGGSVCAGADLLPPAGEGWQSRAAVRDGNAPSPPPKEAIQEAISPPASHSKEESERRRRNSKPEKLDYDTVFICGSNITARLGKQVYIRKEYHDRIQKMLHVIGGNEVTIAAFLDNVLTHHFTLFQDEIAESFKRHMESYNL